MHSSIFQISEMPIDKENYLNEDTLYQGEGSYYDYCENINDEGRRERIADLIKTLPKGMFELVDDDTIRYNGGADKWKEEFVATLQEKAKEVTTENCTMWIGAVYQLEKYLKNPLDTGYQFYMDEQGITGYAEQSYEFLRTVSELEPGTWCFCYQQQQPYKGRDN